MYCDHNYSVGRCVEREISLHIERKMRWTKAAKTIGTMSHDSRGTLAVNYISQLVQLIFTTCVSWPSESKVGNCCSVERMWAWRNNCEKLRCWGIASMRFVLGAGGGSGGVLLVGFCGRSSLCLVNLLWEWLINETFVDACLYRGALTSEQNQYRGDWVDKGGFRTIALSDHPTFCMMTFTMFASHLIQSYRATRHDVGIQQQ